LFSPGVLRQARTASFDSLWGNLAVAVRGSVLDVLTPYDAALIRETFEHLMLDLWSHAVKPIDTEQDAEPPLKDSREFVRLFGFALKDLHDTCARWRDRAGATRPRWEAAVALLSSLSCTADSLPQGTCGEYIDDINQGGLTFPCLNPAGRLASDVLTGVRVLVR